jgi:hypothetical protein
MHVKDIDNIVIAGCFRSGTTAMARILSMHPELFITGELITFNSNQGHITNKFQQIKNEYPHIGKCVFEPTLGNKYEEFIKRLVPGQDRWKILQMIYDMSGKQCKYYGDKVPEYVFSLFRLNKTLNKPKVVFCIRDPRDVIDSQLRAYKGLLARHNNNVPPVIRRNWWAKERIEDCIYMPAHERNWLQFMTTWESVKDKLDYIEVNYTHLVNNKKKPIDIANFLGVDGDAMQEVFGSVFNPVRHENWKKQIPQIDSILPGNWKAMMRRYGFKVG